MIVLVMRIFRAFFGGSENKGNLSLPCLSVSYYRRIFLIWPGINGIPAMLHL